jgi:hypothetical protein
MIFAHRKAKLLYQMSNLINLKSLTPSAASCKRILDTKSRSKHQDHEEKNNLFLCLWFFLGDLVFESLLAKKCKINLVIE